MPSLQETILKVINDPRFIEVMRLQHGKETADLEAMCKCCAKLCKQSADFQALAQFSLCHQSIEVSVTCMGAIPNCEHEESAMLLPGSTLE